MFPTYVLAIFLQCIAIKVTMYAHIMAKVERINHDHPIAHAVALIFITHTHTYMHTYVYARTHIHIQWTLDTGCSCTSAAQ